MIETKALAPGEKLDFSFRLADTTDSIVSVEYESGSAATIEPISNDGHILRFWLTVAEDTPLMSRCNITAKVLTSEGRHIVKMFELVVKNK